jgi:hypothetical protein
LAVAFYPKDLKICSSLATSLNPSAADDFAFTVPSAFEVADLL